MLDRQASRGVVNRRAWWTSRWTCVFGLLLLWCSLVGASSFVKVEGHNFVINGKPFYFAGFNAYWLIEHYHTEEGHKIINEFLDDAQALGLTVGRTWAFNLGLPRGPGDYDETQFAGLDFLVESAGQRNIKLVLCLGNLWNAYKGPEEFLAYATGSAENKTVLDFYYDRATRDLYKQHMAMFVNRTNTLTGVVYRDDPTILGWNIMNEPRCPGCDLHQQQIHHSWMLEMASYLKQIDPNHLVSMSTEGFFQQRPENMYHLFNPGAGGQCEGEDWLVLTEIPEVDYATLHVYERHMEQRPRIVDNPAWPVWEQCNFECYLNWFVEYLDLHEKLTLNQTRKPLVLEEFGATWWHTDEYDRKVLFKIIFDKLVASKEQGGVFAGAMFWNAAYKHMADYDGYNVYINKSEYFTPDLVFSEAKLARAGKLNPRPTMVPWTVVRNNATLDSLSDQAVEYPLELPPEEGVRPVPTDVLPTMPSKTIISGGLANGTPTSVGQMPMSATLPKASAAVVPINITQPGQVTNTTRAALPLGTSQGLDRSNKTSLGSTVPITAQADATPLPVLGRRLKMFVPLLGPVEQLTHQRGLKIQDLTLDEFRRGSWRELCAAESAKTWRPYHMEVFADIFDLEVQPVYDLTKDMDMVEIIAEATRKLNNPAA